MKSKGLAQKLLDLQKDAGVYAVPNDFGARLSQAGAVGLNATTSQDATQYMASLPSNKLELWFAMEADRFQVQHLAHLAIIFTKTNEKLM